MMGKKPRPPLSLPDFGCCGAGSEIELLQLPKEYTSEPVCRPERWEAWVHPVIIEHLKFSIGNFISCKY